MYLQQRKFQKQVIQTLLDTHPADQSGAFELYVMSAPETTRYYLTDTRLIVALPNLDMVNCILDALIAPHISHLSKRERAGDLRTGVAQEERKLLLLSEEDKDLLLKNGVINWRSTYHNKEDGWRKTQNPINVLSGMPGKLWQGRLCFPTYFPHITMEIPSDYYPGLTYNVVPSFMLFTDPSDPQAQERPQLFGMQYAYVRLFRWIMQGFQQPAGLLPVSIIAPDMITRVKPTEPIHAGLSILPYPGSPQDILVGAAHLIMEKDTTIEKLTSFTTMFTRSQKSVSK